MDDSSQKKELDPSVIDNVTDMEDSSSEKYRKMERRVLWKLDLHVLPPLALVCTSIYLLSTPSLISYSIAMAGELHRSNEHREREVRTLNTQLCLLIKVYPVGLRGCRQIPI